jgi:ubiquinone/menaquinone biosynthesis C-methylase UbiE
VGPFVAARQLAYVGAAPYILHQDPVSRTTLFSQAANSAIPRLCHTRRMRVTDRLMTYPSFWRVFAKYLYPLTTRWFADATVLLNLGYEEDPPMALPLSPSDEPNRFGIQLYHRTATQVDLSDKRVLEVGCGHGGGASYLMRTLNPASYTGLDLNQAGIKHCQKSHNLPGLDFLHGNAENLPFDDRSFDAVINVESSHCYPRLPQFFAEVARVLRSAGHFLYADLLPHSSIAEWEAALADAPMRMLSQKEINAEVLRGLEKISPRVPNVIRLPMPALLRGLAYDEGGVQGGRPYRAAQRSEFSYRMYLFIKD